MIHKTVACHQCGKSFLPRTKKHSFCCKKCYRQFYWQKKEKISPFFVCPRCRNKTKLDFDPKKKFKKFENFVCPYCGYNKEDREEEIPVSSNIC